MKKFKKFLAFITLSIVLLTPTIKGFANEYPEIKENTTVGENENKNDNKLEKELSISKNKAINVIKNSKYLNPNEIDRFIKTTNNSNSVDKINEIIETVSNLKLFEHNDNEALTYKKNVLIKIIKQTNLLNDKFKNSLLGDIEKLSNKEDLKDFNDKVLNLLNRIEEILLNLKINNELTKEEEQKLNNLIINSINNINDNIGEIVNEVVEHWKKEPKNENNEEKEKNQINNTENTTKVKKEKTTNTITPKAQKPLPATNISSFPFFSISSVISGIGLILFKKHKKQ